MLHQFPFAIVNFHSDNGSEFINDVVAQLLRKLYVEQAKSRPRRPGPDALVETKNAAIVRKHIGWRRLDAGCAERLNQFYSAALNPHVNYHRRSAEPESTIDPKGRKWTVYKQWLTPFEMLLSLDRPNQFLRPGITVEAPQRVAAAISDTDAAQRLQTARAALAEHLHNAA